MSQFPPDDTARVSDDQVLKHLDIVLRSSSFASSKRCSEFLRYIVVETIEGRGDSISERNIAREVFGKGINFDPSEDSLVRVKAREVRKRLSECYDALPESTTRIEIPLGSYIPQIQVHQIPATQDSVAVAHAAKSERLLSRRRLVFSLGGGVGLAGLGFLWRTLSYRNTPLDDLWQPVFATKTPLIIFIPILTDRKTGMVGDRVGIGPAAALRRAADFLDAHHYPYHLRFGSDLNFKQLTEQPSLLLGGFSSIWTQLMTHNLRFTLVGNENSADPAVVDTQTGKTWKPVNLTSERYADQDYGILSRIFNKQSGQITMIAAGITTFGTEGAADVFFNEVVFGELAKTAPAGWKSMNFEAVVQVSIIGTTPSLPQIVASHFW